MLEEIQDIHLLCTFHGNKGVLAVKRKEFLEAEAEFRQSLNYARQSNDWLAIVNSLRNLGNVNFETGRLFRAILWYRRALIAAETLDSSPELQVVHASYAVALHQAKRLPEAEGHFNSARSYAAEHGDRDGWARLTMDAGTLAFQRGDMERAIKLLADARDEFRTLGNSHWQSIVLQNLAKVYSSAGNEAQATTSVDEALHLLPVEAHAERAQIMRQAAHTMLEMRNTERADDFFQRSLIEGKQTSDRAWLAWESAVAAVALANCRDISAALPFFATSLDAFHRIEDRIGEHSVRNDRAIALTEVRRFEEARLDYDVCLDLAKESGEWELEIQTLLNRGEMERRSDKLDEARLVLQRAIDLARRHGDERAEAEALGNLGITLTNLGNWDEAQDVFANAQLLACTLNDPHVEAAAVGGLATIQFHAGEFSAAVELYRQAAEMNQTADDPIHQLEDLAGLVESLAAIGDVDAMATEGQRLIDCAQEVGSIRFAVQSLIRAAQSLAKLELLDDAIEAFAVAITGEISDFSGDGPDAVLGWSIYATVDTFSQIAPDQAESFYDQVVNQICDQQALASEDLVPLRKLILEVQLMHGRLIAGANTTEASHETAGQNGCDNLLGTTQA